MDKNLDIILLQSNKQMETIINWVKDNNINKNELIIPLNDARIDFLDEGLRVDYSKENNIIHFKTYSTDKNVAIFEFDYDLKTEEFENINTFAVNELSKFRILNLISKDNTIGKLIYKFISIMYYMVYKKADVVEVNKKELKQSNKKKTKRNKKNNKVIINKTIYKFINTDSEPLNHLLTNETTDKRIYTQPNHSFGVKGHFRHYKNGKTVWVNEYIKGIGKKENKIYTLKK
jgi:hypothetical protein